MLLLLFLALILQCNAGAEVDLQVSPDLENEEGPVFNFKCTVENIEDNYVDSISIFRQTSPTGGFRRAPRELVGRVHALHPDDPFAGPGLQLVSIEGHIDSEDSDGSYLEVNLTNLRITDLGLYTCEVLLVDSIGQVTFAKAEAKVLARAGAVAALEPRQTTVKTVETTVTQTASTGGETVTGPDGTPIVQEVMTGPVETAAVPEETTAAPAGTPIVPLEQTTGPSETTIVPKQPTAGPAGIPLIEEETTKLAGTGVFSEVTTTETATTALGDETTALGDETTALVGETTALGDEITTLVGETTALGDETTTLVGETTALVGETTTLVGETTALVGEPTAETATTALGIETTTETATAALGDQTPATVETTEEINLSDVETTDVAGETTTDLPGVTTVAAEESTSGSNETSAVLVESTTHTDDVEAIEDETEVADTTTVGAEETTEDTIVDDTETTTLTTAEPAETTTWTEKSTVTTVETTPDAAAGPEQLTELAEVVESLGQRLDEFDETVKEFENKIGALKQIAEDTDTTDKPNVTEPEAVTSYFVYENASYLFFKSNLLIDVASAQTECDNRRFYLTEVNNAGELQAIAKEISPHVVSDALVLVAGQKEIGQDIWLYQTSKEQVDFFAWGPNEPIVQAQGNECLALRKAEDDVTMVSVPCTGNQTNFYFLCEHDD